ncbi:MAG: nuclear transport factor 2 family protein [Candidatus Binatia bacterium]|nr:nuclear transport factor 2 family protein [Candidatus Binatia bacterium]
MSTETYVALRRLQNRYADIVTRRAWAELAEIFRPDCRLDLDLGDRSATFTGPGEVGAFIGKAIEPFSFFQFVILNTVIEIDEESDRAAARMYMHELRVEADTGRRTDAYGVYHDRFDRDADGCWRFARRRYGSFSRTAPEGVPGDQVVFPLPEIDLRTLLAED